VLPDSTRFWKDKLNLIDEENEEDWADLILQSKTKINAGKDAAGFYLVYADTNSTRKLIQLNLLKDNRLFTLGSIIDSIAGPSDFVQNFFSSFKPLEQKLGLTKQLLVCILAQRVFLI
jgi:hypothetical protein